MENGEALENGEGVLDDPVAFFHFIGPENPNDMENGVPADAPPPAAAAEHVNEVPNSPLDLNLPPTPDFSGKKIILVVTGAPAAKGVIQICEVFRQFNAQIQVVVTDDSLKFFDRRLLSESAYVYADADQIEWKEKTLEIVHLVDWADALVVAPLSLKHMSMISVGLVDDIASEVCRSWPYGPRLDQFGFEIPPKPAVFFVQVTGPNRITRAINHNYYQLQNWGVRIFDGMPATPMQLVAQVFNALNGVNG
ncbi:coenzyme A biosynthesis bifunctional protein CoaBC [Striga asiatica]|uniref:phosphopantothenoylcysteine decarboxylase n=1 Tax=Striga asiatica TaxID=4170 RepID=A0A5A7NW97_STRAF|nr:coenzyme A biosynthesis bifunctional protein CoaBC [Striga asiatica]